MGNATGPWAVEAATPDGSRELRSPALHPTLHRMKRTTSPARRLLIAAIALCVAGWANPSVAATGATVSDYRLSLSDELPMLRGYAQPSVETPPAAWRFAWGPWGVARWGAWMTSGLRLDLPVGTIDPSAPYAVGWHPRWGLEHAHPNLDDAWSVQRVFGPSSPDFFGPTNAPPSFWSMKGWNAGSVSEACSHRAVRFTRYQGETDSFPLLACDGSVSADAIDRLSVMARPPGVARPSLPLPDEPESGAGEGEWLRSVRLVNPRLVWLLEQVAEAYPFRGIYIVSGYRTGPNEGMHALGRAIDLQVMGVSNERVYRTCRRFQDVGCGYYPNHAFVHMDVRPAGTGSRYWVDVSEPGQASEYVASWPGVEDGRGATFDAGAR